MSGNVKSNVMADEPPDTDGDSVSGRDRTGTQWVQVNQAYYDTGSDTELATTLVSAIAEARDTDPLGHAELPPLYEFVDPQALEDLFFGPPGTAEERELAGVVEFLYDDCKISLRADGWIFVYERREPPAGAEHPSN